MAERTAKVDRNTKETQISITVNLDGSGKGNITTGVGFFDHMLDQLARHGLFDIDITATGDLHIDAHHTIEDVGIVLGQAFKQALGDKSGITRYGNAVIPMDEALVMTAIDISGRGMSNYAVDISEERIGELPVEMVPEFFTAFANNAGLTLHVRKIAGSNAHHIVEGAFKSFARALSQAVSISERQKGVPSTKGTL